MRELDVSKPRGAFEYFWTSREYSTDKRTGAIAVLVERRREATDRPGRSSHVWDWRVVQEGYSGRLAAGTASSRPGARAACRKIVRALKAKAST